MPVPFDGTTTCPADTNAVPFMGLWDAVSGVFRAWRGTSAGHAVVQVEKGSRVHFTATFGDSAVHEILAANANRKEAWLYNNASTIVYLYTTSAATAANGTPLPPGAGIPDNNGTDAWYGVPASGTMDVRGWEIS